MPQKLRAFTEEIEKEQETPQKNNNSLNLSTVKKVLLFSLYSSKKDGGSSKKKVGFNLKPSMSEAKAKDLSPSLVHSRNCLGYLFPLSSSNSPKYLSKDPEKPTLPYKFYCDGSYELK